MKIDSGKLQENQSQNQFRPGVLRKEILGVPQTLSLNLMSAISSEFWRDMRMKLQISIHFYL